MIKLTIDGKDYLHPSKLEEVTLQQWIDLMKVEKKEGETDLRSDLRAFSKFTGVPQKALNYMARNTSQKEMYFYMEQVRQMITKVSTSVLDEKPITSLEINGKTYYVCKDIDDDDFSKYLDCTDLMKVIDSEWDFLPYMMAIYCLQEGQVHAKDQDQLEQRAKTMRKAKAVDGVVSISKQEQET
jgi:hypothetical protein